jgi:hypothetical protein
MYSVYGLIGLAMLTATTQAVDTTIKIHTDSPFYVKGGELLKPCSADAKTTNGPEVCDDYISGVVDTIVANRDTIQGYQICWPNPAPNLDVYRDMLVHYLRDHPEYADGNAASVIDSMLFEKYRCPGTTAPAPDQVAPHKN